MKLLRKGKEIAEIEDFTIDGKDIVVKEKGIEHWKRYPIMGGFSIEF